ncbi:unnamed protein product [Rangifer tarandus platyrhynchus]|uniref:Uncharacterized protein n=1 Tax=Rangifer tarandus platyrhynchus TaxID=3082113 RepID=A0ACB1KEH4_RANTA
MARNNCTLLTEFILLGLADTLELQTILFFLFLVIYTLTVVGNIGMILLIRTDSRLHTPMYFFLAILSFADVGYSSTITPKMLVDLLSEKNQNGTISFLACAAQMYFFLVFGATECFLLTVMAYDRYVAICSPLRCSLLMDSRLCVHLAAGCWVSGIPVHVIFSLPFCGSNTINHFFCDIPPLLKLACGNIFVNEMMVYIFTLLFVGVPFMLILASYSKIICTILRLPTARGRAKAFSTCSSHLLAVLLFFGSATIAYLRPKSRHPAGTDRLLSLFYTIVTPMFNPMIYSLRNKDVIAALRKLLLKKVV